MRWLGMSDDFTQGWQSSPMSLHTLYKNGKFADLFVLSLNSSIKCTASSFSLLSPWLLSDWKLLNKIKSLFKKKKIQLLLHRATNAGSQLRGQGLATPPGVSHGDALLTALCCQRCTCHSAFQQGATQHRAQGRNLTGGLSREAALLWESAHLLTHLPSTPLSLAPMFYSSLNLIYNYRCSSFSGIWCYVSPLDNLVWFYLVYRKMYCTDHKSCGTTNYKACTQVTQLKIPNTLPSMWPLQITAPTFPHW